MKKAVVIAILGLMVMLGGCGAQQGKVQNGAVNSADAKTQQPKSNVNNGGQNVLNAALNNSGGGQTTQQETKQQNAENSGAAKNQQASSPNNSENQQTQAAVTANSTNNESQGAEPGNSNNSDNQVPQISTVPNSIGSKATDFTLNDLSGKSVSLSDFKGKKVLLNFWATWCPPCNAEMPFIQQLSNGVNAGGYVVLAVNIGESENVVKKFLSQKGYSFYTLFDQSQQVAEEYMITGIPTTYFIDENGVIKNVHVGVLDEAETKTFLGIK